MFQLFDSLTENGLSWLIPIIPLTILVIWGGIGAFISTIAKRNGRGEYLWFFAGFLFPPLIIFLLILGPTQEEKARRIYEEERLRAKARKAAD